jgi:hypothetical protein
MCKCCAPIQKRLAIFFILSRLFLIGISVAALSMANEVKLKEGQTIVDNKEGLFFGYLFISIFNFFTLWSTFCCVNEEEKECCQSSDDACWCACICFSEDLCISCDDGENNLNIFMLGIMLALFFFRFYIWILVKCCGKRSRYCIQIFAIFLDIETGIIIIVSLENLPAFFIITTILFLLSGLITIIIFIYINVNYRKISSKDLEIKESSSSLINETQL